MGFHELVKRVVSADKVRLGCDKCTHDRSQFVPSKVVQGCDIAVIGDVPSTEDVMSKKPFSGFSGEIIRDLMKKEGIDPDACSWLNVVKCRSAKSTTPDDKIVQLCGKKNLQAELTAIQPKVLLLLGPTAFSFFFRKGDNDKSRGNFRRWGNVRVMSTFAPELIIQNGGIRSTWGAETAAAIRRDVSKVRRLLDGSLHEGREYTLVRTAEEAERFTQLLESQMFLSCDIESTSLRSWAPGACVLTIAFCWAKGKSVCFPLYHPDLKDEQLRSVFESCVRRVLKSESVKTWHNAKYDVPYLQQLQYEVSGRQQCTMLMYYLLDENRRSYGLKQLTAQELDGYLELLDPSPSTPLEQLYLYNCEDADNGWRLYQKGKASMDSGLWSVHDDLLIPGSMCLAEAERVGVRVDLDKVRQLQRDLGVELKTKLAAANKELPPGRSVTSNKDLAAHLFGTLGLPVVRKTKTGASVDADTLKELSEMHGCALAGDMLSIRSLEKLLTTYLEPYPKLVGPDGRIHCSFMFTRTTTGRLSSEDPNLQNVPRRKDIRTLFVSSPGWKFIYGDLSNAEMRVAASLANDPVLVDAFCNDQDIHQLTASKMTGVPISEVTKEARQNAKPVNFGLLYGQSARGLQAYAKSTYGITLSDEESVVYRKAFFESYSGLPAWYGRIHRELYANECIRLVTGRLRRFPGINAMRESDRRACERQAVNSEVQGPTSDLTLQTLIHTQMHAIRNKMQARVVLTVHDSILGDGPEEECLELGKVMHDFVNTMRYPWLKVPMRLDVEIGEKWGDLSALKL